MSDTELTIIGMIAAFVTASVTVFLAEPVKIHFQNRANLTNLRLALYQEIIWNYTCLRPVLKNQWGERTVGLGFLFLIQKHNLRTECYKAAISSQLESFYQLSEVQNVHYLYAHISYIEKSPMLQYGQFADEVDEVETDRVFQACKTYVTFVAEKFASKEFDRKILSRIVPKEMYNGILEKGYVSHEQQTKARQSGQKHIDNSGEAPQTHNPEGKGS